MRLRPEELTVINVSELNKRNSFESEIRDIIGDSFSLKENQGKKLMEQDDFDVDSEDEDVFENVVSNADAVDSVGNQINQQSVTDILINAEILIPQDEAVYISKALRCSIDVNIIGTFYETPNLNSLPEE